MRSKMPVPKPTPEVVNPVTRAKVGEAKLAAGQIAGRPIADPIPKSVSA